MRHNASIGRGTEPPLELELPEGTSLTDYEFIRLTIEQSGRAIIIKELDDIYEEGGKLCFDITQEDTLRLDDRMTCDIQLRFKPVGGKVDTTHIKDVTVRRLLGPEDVI